MNFFSTFLIFFLQSGKAKEGHGGEAKENKQEERPPV
jgi:hypothetical protein